jgi:hypothetical protein
MKAVAGSVVALAGAMLVAAATVAHAMMLSADRVRDSGAVSVGLAGVVLGLVGLAVFAAGLASDRRDRPR